MCQCADRGWECGIDRKKAAQIKCEKNTVPIPCDTHNALSWDCSLCGARNHGDTGAAPCWQCRDDPEIAEKIEKTSVQLVIHKYQPRAHNRFRNERRKGCFVRGEQNTPNK